MKRRVALVLLLACACQQTSASVVADAKFGVFFGGQIQQLQEISKELDPSRQSYGFRVTFRKPLARDVELAWELLLPVTEQGAPRAAIVGQAVAKAGQASLDVPLAFRPSDPLGSWHARLRVAGEVAVDRDFSLVAPPPAKATPKSAPRRPLGAPQE